MGKKFIKYGLSVGIAALFLWLAFRNVRFEEIWASMGQISYGWILPTTIIMLISHYVRAERWRLVLEQKDYDNNRMTLFTGVMVGYLVNYAFPRMGEVSRCVYVGKKEGQSSTELLGTVVLERIIDLLTLMTIMAFVIVYLIADPELVGQLFGRETIAYLNQWLTWSGILELAGYGLAVALILALVGGGVYWLSQHVRMLAKVVDRFQELVRLFVEGVIAVKNVKNWPLFILYTIIIWIGYIAMSYFPLWMLDLATNYQISFVDAIAITAIIAVGIALPSPGGVGTYHYFAKQVLLVLFAVPTSIGLTYAVITHAMLMVMVVISTLCCLAIDRYLHGTAEAESLWKVMEGAQQPDPGKRN
jgi:uncharacterized protein (TIRG00374 family)